MLRWGILGTAEVARKNWKAIRLSGNSIVTAVASRTPSKAQAFIEECQSEVPFDTQPHALGSYSELLASPDVDAVYIPLPTGLRKEWVLRAAASGKHVICEKPCATSAADLEAMIAACEENKVQFMDGVMFVHAERTERLHALIREGVIGDVRRVTSHFSFRAPESFVIDNIRSHAELEPMGCLGDLGWYCARFTLGVFDGKMPRTISARLIAEVRHNEAAASVPAELVADLSYENATASFFCSFLTAHQQRASVGGTLGHIQIEDFVLPFAGTELRLEVYKPEFVIRGCEFSMQPNHNRISLPEHSHGHPTAQEARLFRHFAEVILAGRRNPDWPAVALKTQRIVDACLASARAHGAAIRL